MKKINRNYVDSDYALALSIQEEMNTSEKYVGSKRSFIPTGSSSSLSSSSSSSSAAGLPPVSNISRKDEIENLDRLYAEELNQQNEQLLLSHPKSPTKKRNKFNEGGRRRGGRGGRGRRDDWDYSSYRTLLDDDLHIPAYHPHASQHPIRHALLPSNIDPKLMELMTRDINANDYEFLLDHFSDHENKKKGLSDIEIDNLLSSFTYRQNNKLKVSDNVIDLCHDCKDVNNQDIIYIDVESETTQKKNDNNDKNDKVHNKENDCSICLAPFLSNEELSILPCLHKFHRVCIKNWLKLSKKCPIDNIEFS